MRTPHAPSRRGAAFAATCPCCCCFASNSADYDRFFLSRLNATSGGFNYGADDGARTRDIQDHNLALYQLSYDRREAHVSTRLRARSQDPN